VPPPAEPPPPEPRQRWRLVVARGPDAPAIAQRELTDAWIEAIESAGLPLAATGGARARPRVAFGAPLPVGMVAAGELIDIVLSDRWPLWRVREALADRLPSGWQLVDLYDEWLAGPALAGRVAAADYRITLGGGAAVSANAIGTAAGALLAASELPRRRAKGSGTVAYDLRPLLVDLAVAEAGPPTVIVARTRFHPELGTGRPEEVVAALGDALGAPIDVASVVRERLVLADELDDEIG
jgi:radical SAM-linked protein